MAGLATAYRLLPTEEQAALREGTCELELCVFLQKEWDAFVAALAEACG